MATPCSNCSIVHPDGDPCIPAVEPADIAFVDTPLTLSKMMLDSYSRQLKAQQEEISRLRQEKLMPGHFTCPKCKFFLLSQTLYMQSGSIGPNEHPVDCSNGCGPMWRVSWEEGYKEMGRRAVSMADEISRLKDESQRRFEKDSETIGSLRAKLSDALADPLARHRPRLSLEKQLAEAQKGAAEKCAHGTFKDEYVRSLRAKLVTATEALKRIRGPGGGDCGCQGRPCECFSEASMSIQLEEQKSTAYEALAKLSSTNTNDPENDLSKLVPDTTTLERAKALIFQMGNCLRGPCDDCYRDADEFLKANPRTQAEKSSDTQVLGECANCGSTAPKVESEKVTKQTCYPCLGEKECEVPGDCRKAKTESGGVA
jgi:hypothetical protein